MPLGKFHDTLFIFFCDLWKTGADMMYQYIPQGETPNKKLSIGWNFKYRQCRDFHKQCLTWRKYSDACIKLTIAVLRQSFVSSVLVSNTGAVAVCCPITASKVCTLAHPSLSHRSATSLNNEKWRETSRNSSRSSGQCCFRKSSTASFRFGT